MLLRLGRGMSAVSSALPSFSFANMADLVFWVDAGNSDTITQSSTLVSQIDDQSPNGFHAVSSGADRPITNVSSMNGVNALSFDGTTFLTSDSLSTYPSGNDQPLSLHLTFKANSSAGTQVITGFGDSSSTMPLFWFGIYAGDFIFTKRDDSNSQIINTVAAADTQEHALSIVHTGQAVTVWLDGFKVIDNEACNAGTASFDQFTLGALRRNSGEEQNFIGLIGEALIFSRTNTESETRKIQNTLMSKWAGLPGAYDFFLIAGQSNAEGRGASGSAPAVIRGAGYLADGAGNITALADPVGGASTGSAWPAFANEWFSITGRSAVFVEQATGGTGLQAATTGPDDWSGSGGLYDASVTAANNALFDLTADFTASRASVNVLWVQGESDAAQTNGTTITASGYQTELEALIGNYKSALGTTNFFISELGRQDNGLLESEYSDIGNAQLSAAANISYAYVVFTDAKYFPEEGKMDDNLHYNQSGLNEMGTMMARVASNPLAPFTPELIYDLVSWHSDDTIVDNSGNVNAWNDKSGSVHITESTNAPSYVSGPPSAARFDGSDDGLDYTGNPYTYGPMWIMAFHKPDTTNQASQIIAGNQGSGVGQNRAYIFNQGVDFGDTNLLHPSPVSGSYIIQAARVEGTGTTAQYISLNGGAETSGAVTRSNIASNFAIGRYANLGGFNYDGEIAEIILGNGMFYGTRRVKLEGYLAHKYDMADLLPGEHAYKNGAPLASG